MTSTYNNYIILIFLFVLMMCCHSKNKESYCNKSKGFISSKDHRFLKLICLTDKDQLPDSLKGFKYSEIYIDSPELINYMSFLQDIDPDEVKIMMINNYNGKSKFAIDLLMFKKLETLFILGDRIEKIELAGKLDCKLRNLNVASSNLKFPEYDSSFKYLERLYYSGSNTSVPKWLENLDSLRILTFNSKNIREIRCDLCLMNSLEVFDISTSDLYQKELSSSTDGNRFLKKYIECKPNLRFEKKLLPQ